MVFPYEISTTYEYIQQETIKSSSESGQPRNNGGEEEERMGGGEVGKGEGGVERRG